MNRIAPKGKGELSVDGKAMARGGLAPWTYFNEELNAVEKDILFRRHWQIACHVSDVPGKGDFITFDMCGERAIVMRGKDDQVRAFHNLCRHRGSRVLSEAKGTCRHVITCPFHAWVYNMDGTLRKAAAAETLPELDPVEHGLKPIEMEVWHGLVFIRFLPGPQPSVAELFAQREEEVAPYHLDEMVNSGGGFYEQEMPINWKAVRDVDNEGYHVPIAHPSLQDLYGPNYYDEPLENGTSRSHGYLTETPGKLWSVRHYKKLLPEVSGHSEQNKRAWLYLGLYPNTVIGLYPTSTIFYQEYPISAGRTIQRSAAYRYKEETREMRATRYLAERIDGLTGVEDTQLIEWSCEAMESSAFDGIILSDLEQNVRAYHDAFRDSIPVMQLEDAPAPNTVAALNAEMSAETSD